MINRDSRRSSHTHHPCFSLTSMLCAGDMQLLHRGWNPLGTPRHTLHGALWTDDTPVMMHEQGQELHIEAVLAVLDRATRARECSSSEHDRKATPSTTSHTRLASEWAQCLRGYLRERPPDGTEAGSLLKFLRQHQRGGYTLAAQGVATCTPRL